MKGIIEDCGFSTAKDVFAHEAKLRYKLPAWPLIPAASMVCGLIAGYRFAQDEPSGRFKKRRCPSFLFMAAEMILCQLRWCMKFMMRAQHIRRSSLWKAPRTRWHIWRTGRAMKRR